MQDQQKRIYEFGPFRLHGQEAVLLRNGLPVPLTPKVFDMLLLLVESSGHLVLKEEIMSRLWPDSFVEEANVNRAISTLRRALADSLKDPAYIETVPKRGYRFVASVAVAEPVEADLILERHTFAEVISEEDEEITGFIDPESERPSERATVPLSLTSLFSGLRGQTLVLIGIAAVMLLAAVVYLFTAGKLGSAATTVRVKSIAVMPFRDIGAGSDEHLGLSLADVLITRLSNLKDVNVRPTSAVLKFEGQDQESAAGGRALGVDAVLEGSIYRSHEQTRVTARLVRVGDQSTIWSGQFDNKASDVLALQNAIVEQVASALALNLSTDDKSTITKPYSESADALQLYAKGRYYWNMRTWAGMNQAEYHFRRAIEKDPSFALAYVGLADVLLIGGPNPEASSTLRKAIELDPNLGEAYGSSGFDCMFHRWDWREAEENFKRAIELRPGYGTAHQWYATLLAITGRLDEAKREMQRALEIDPMSANFLADAGQMHYFAREYEQAEDYCRKAVEVTPDFNFAHDYLFHIYLKSGKSDQAYEEYIKLGESYNCDSKAAIRGESPEVRLRALYRESGINGLLRCKLARDSRTAVSGFSYPVARLYALLGDKQQALAWLEKACENKDFLLPFMRPDPIFDDLREEPRYQAVLRQMNLAQ